VGGIDLAIFRAINGWPDSLEPLFVTLSEGNKWLVVRLILLGFLIYCLWRKETRVAAIVAIIAWPIANEICDVLKNSLQMTRPSVDLLDANFRVNKLTSFGTASAHSANMMAVATAYLFYWRKAGYVWLVIAILTGISRIYVGVHYPYQVLWGWLVGAGTAFAVIAIWEGWKKHRGLHQPDGVHEEMPEEPAV